MRKFAIVSALGCAALVASGAAPRALLIEGDAQNGRDWKEQTPALKNIFEAGGLFQVDAIPAKAGDEPAFEKYKVVIMNYGGDAWSSSTLTALDKYLKNGGGMVLLAGAGSAFPKWEEFDLMLGVSAAPNRGQSAGPLWFYKDGNVAFDNSATKSDVQTLRPDKPILVTIRDTEHPVTKGLPLEWMHVPDELVGNLRGPGKNMTLIATAFSDPSKGGTGRNEPQMVAVAYGKGRIFHSILGRTPDALQCAGLQTILQRAAEWAATGKVTQKLPSDFPDEEKVSRRLK